MKRTLILLAALLLSGCATPVAGKAQAQRPAQSSPSDPDADPQTETVSLDDSTVSPEPTPEPVPVEKRFPGRFSETPEYGKKN